MKRFCCYCNLLVFNRISIIVAICIAVMLFFAGRATNSFDVALASIMLFWLYGMFFCFINLYELYAYAIMHFMIFVFYLSRPLIANMYDLEWTYWNKDALEKGLLSILVCEIAMLMGSAIVKQVNRADELSLKKCDIGYVHFLQTTFLIIVAISGLICAYSVLNHYIALKDLPYESIYVSSEIYEPAYIRGTTTLFPYAVFAYLATMPKKRTALLVLGIYIALGIPYFLLGNRSSLVLRIAFAVSYFFIRDYIVTRGRNRWITNKIKIGFIVFVLFSIAFLGAYNYIRTGKLPSDQTHIPIMLDFFYRQGTTFETLCQGLHYETIIRSLPHTTLYGIGPMIDTVKHSTLSQWLFNAKSLGSGNSLNMVLNSNSLAHKLSYVVLGEAYYLEGHGRGSSFLLELYYDGGFALIGAFCFALGVFLGSINRIIQKGNWFINVLVIATLSRVFYIPRSSTCDFMSFLLTPHFWLLIIAIVVANWYLNVIDFRGAKLQIKKTLRLKKI